jgi:hypothetical protein
MTRSSLTLVTPPLRKRLLVCQRHTAIELIVDALLGLHHESHEPQRIQQRALPVKQRLGCLRELVIFTLLQVHFVNSLVDRLHDFFFLDHRNWFG